MIWWIALIGSLAGLAIVLPYSVLLFADAAREDRDMRGRRPCPPVQTADRQIPRMPTAKLSRRDYRRICKAQRAYRPYRAVFD